VVGALDLEEVAGVAGDVPGGVHRGILLQEARRLGCTDRKEGGRKAGPDAVQRRHSIGCRLV
jgi:hypothetical protein